MSSRSRRPRYFFVAIGSRCRSVSQGKCRGLALISITFNDRWQYISRSTNSGWKFSQNDCHNYLARLAGQTPWKVANPKKNSRTEITNFSLKERRESATQFVTSELYDVQLQNGFFKKGKKKRHMGVQLMWGKDHRFKKKKSKRLRRNKGTRF